jgi:hypothetical protein
VNALEQARQALAAGDAAACLWRVEAYETAYPVARLQPEARLLRLEALVSLGEIDEARALGRRLLARGADAAYAQRVRSLLGDDAR